MNAPSESESASHKVSPTANLPSGDGVQRGEILLAFGANSVRPRDGIDALGDGKLPSGNPRCAGVGLSCRRHDSSTQSGRQARYWRDWVFASLRRILRPGRRRISGVQSFLPGGFSSLPSLVSRSRIERLGKGRNYLVPPGCVCCAGTSLLDKLECPATACLVHPHLHRSRGDRHRPPNPDATRVSAHGLGIDPKSDSSEHHRD